MATLTAANVSPVWVFGNAAVVVLFSLRNVTTGDTIDLSTVPGAGSLMVVKSGVVMGESDFVEIAATFTGTVVTMPSGLSKSSGYLLVLGC